MLLNRMRSISTCSTEKEPTGINRGKFHAVICYISTKLYLIGYTSCIYL